VRHPPTKRVVLLFSFILKQKNKFRIIVEAGYLSLCPHAPPTSPEPLVVEEGAGAI